MRARSVVPPETIAAFGYLTPQDEFGDVERGNPLPYTLPPERRREVGLEREMWRLEVVADAATDAKVEQPLSKALGTALDFAGLMKLAEQHAIRYMKAITCNNLGEPLGMGLWEGVPLRVVVWMARPTENVRRVCYYGYHNDDPAQMFHSSLPIRPERYCPAHAQAVRQVGPCSNPPGATHRGGLTVAALASGCPAQERPTGSGRCELQS